MIMLVYKGKCLIRFMVLDNRIYDRSISSWEFINFFEEEGEGIDKGFIVLYVVKVIRVLLGFIV